MTFDTDKYSDILAQDCLGGESGVSWYACTGTEDFPFMGCCAINPCSEGSCPTDELRGSKLSSNERNAQVFLGGATTTTSSSSSSSTATSTIASETSAETTSSGSNSGSDDGGLSRGAIIGIAVGATAVGILAIGLFLFWFWRKARRSRDHADASKGSLMGFGGRESSQFQDMKYQSQYSPNTVSFHGLQSPQSSNFTHPNSPQPYHDRGSYHPGMSPSPRMQSPPAGHQWAGSPPPEQQGFLAAGGMYDKSPPAHMTTFNTGVREDAPAELPATMTQQSSELSGVSELPANPNTVSMQSYSGVTGRESEVSGISENGRHVNRS